MATRFRDALLGADLRTVVVAGCGVVVPLVYALYGQPAFFRSHVGPALSLDRDIELYAQYYRFAFVFVTFFALPVLIARVLGLHPARLGLRFGDARWSLKVLVPAAVVVVPLAYLSAGDPAFMAEYPMAKSAAASPATFVVYEAAYLAYYVGWEFFFRGFLLFGLKERLGPFGANMFQTVPSVLLHIVKPAGEAWASLVAGPLFGAAALKSGSMLYVLAFHYGLGVVNDVFCALRAGLIGG